jgi:hypothetical protein
VSKESKESTIFESDMFAPLILKPSCPGFQELSQYDKSRLE